jgi:DNA-binding PadR family transcriptional regulator
MWKKWIDFYGEFQDSMQRFGKFGGLRLWILCALRDGPKNGVEIMDAIQERHEKLHERHPYGYHGGKHRGWRPSPGSIYPMLKKMVEEDLIIKMEDGRYDLAATGQEFVNEMFQKETPQHSKRFTAESALKELDSYVSYLEDLKEEKLIPHREEIGKLAERLKKLEKSLHEN